MKKTKEDVLKAFADSLGANYDTSNDQGHKNLISDLHELVQEAVMYEFHDFKNEKYGAPKMTLHNKLQILKDNVENGRYDN